MRNFILAFAATAAFTGAAIAQEAPALAPTLNGNAEASDMNGDAPRLPDVMATSSTTADDNNESGDITSPAQVTRQTEDDNLSGSAN